MQSLSLARDGSKEDSYTTLNDFQLLLLASHDQPSRVKANTKIQGIDIELYLEGAFLFVFKRTYDALSVRLGYGVTMFAPSNQRIDSPVKQAKERVTAPCPPSERTAMQTRAWYQARPSRLPLVSRGLKTGLSLGLDPGISRNNRTEGSEKNQHQLWRTQLSRNILSAVPAGPPEQYLTGKQLPRWDVPLRFVLKYNYAQIDKGFYIFT